MARTLLTEARDRQCRTPLWGNELPTVDAMFICGAPTLQDKSYCKECRYKLTVMSATMRKAAAPIAKDVLRLVATGA